MTIFGARRRYLAIMLPVLKALSDHLMRVSNVHLADAEAKLTINRAKALDLKELARVRGGKVR
jgi:hypothetical protein